MIELRTNNIEDGLKLLDLYKNSSQAVLMIYKPEKLVVYYTGKDDINLEACERLGAEILPWKSNGGSAVASPGDLGIHIIIPGKYSKWCTFVRSKMRFWLMRQGLDVNEERNDLTVRGSKVFGYTETVTDEFSQGSIFIAMESSNKLVDEICLKPKTRETDGLLYYGITSEEVIKVIIDATKEYLNLVGLEKGGN